MLELSGGNDGLNTVIPYADDVYHKSRPTLRVEPGKVLKLDDRVGLHPSLKDLHRLWESRQPGGRAGRWLSGPESLAFSVDGDLADRNRRPRSAGRLAGAAGRCTPRLELCHVGQGAMPLAVQGRKVVAQSLASVAAYRLGPGAELPSRFKEGSVDPSLAEIRQRYTSTVELARRLESLRVEAAASGDAETLEGRLETIAGSSRPTRRTGFIYTSQDGFDTHAGQLYAHQQLLQTMGKALAGFLERLSSRASSTSESWSWSFRSSAAGSRRTPTAAPTTGRRPRC